jgi:hypothetical protein
MAKDTPITSFLTEEEAAGLSDAAKGLTAGDLLSSMKGFTHKKSDGPLPQTDAAGALTFADWKTIGGAFARQAMRRQSS